MFSLVVLQLAFYHMNSLHFRDFSGLSQMVPSRVSVHDIHVSILIKSISGCFRADRIPVGQITVRYRFRQNAIWICSILTPIVCLFLYCCT